MPKVIAVGNLKGGVGKSTLAVNIAAALAQDAGRRVVLFDADAQETATAWAMQGLLPMAVVATPLDTAADAEAWLRDVLQSPADVIVIDLPPHMAASTQAALGIADLVLVPVTPSGADLMATVKAIELVRQARTLRPSGGPACLLVPSKVDRRTAAGREVEQALAEFGEAVAAPVCQRSAFADAFAAGRWIGDFAPGTTAADEIAALAAQVWKVVQHG